MTQVTASFDFLVSTLSQTHEKFVVQTARAINTSLTLRNWLFGFYIEEYERQGVDRQQYGDKLLDQLADKLMRQGISRCDRRELYRYRQFYLTYPQIRVTLPPELQPPSLQQQIVESLSPQLRLSGSEILAKLSFSHIVELLKCEDASRRAFYEMECIRGSWSVRELKRQIASLYFERSGLSSNKQGLSDLTQANAETATAALTIRDPYVFEFLGLKPQEVMSESHLEDQLLDKLQGFLLELGHGFCFEARQKRILIGETYHFIDMVFYHRILKCHVLVELKLAEFNHENIGQLNTYVSWYRKNMMLEGDNPPIGILLCTQKDHALVEYALAGIDNDIFVSKYLLELPDKEQMQEFIQSQLLAREPMENL